jgi:hypothetical protein
MSTMTTQRQIESHGLNGTGLATGSSTLDGKDASKRNAMKHGLAGVGVIRPEEESQLVADRAASWAEAFQPETPFKVWLTGQAARESVRIERCFVEEIVIRSRLVLSARFRWNEDRELAAVTLLDGISRKPALVSRKLRQTAQGCDLLLERWRCLVRILDVNGDWNEKQTRMALDLLGIPTEFRTETTLMSLKPEADPVEAARAVALAEIAALEALRAGVLDDLDGTEQGFAELGVGLDNHPALKELRRREAESRRWLRWALGQLAADAGPIAEEPAPIIEPVATATPPSPEPGTRPEPSPAPASRPASVPAPVVHRAPYQGMSLTEAFTASPESGNRRERRARRKQAKRR